MTPLPEPPDMPDEALNREIAERTGWHYEYGDEDDISAWVAPHGPIGTLWERYPQTREHLYFSRDFNLLLATKDRDGFDGLITILTQHTELDGMTRFRYHWNTRFYPQMSEHCRYQAAVSIGEIAMKGSRACAEICLLTLREEQP